MGKTKQFNYSVVVDRSKLQPLVMAQNMKTVGSVSSASMAKELRDLMRETYEENVYGSGSEYQANPAYNHTSSLSEFIVMRPSGKVNGSTTYEVGAKKNQIVGRQYVSEILAYMDQGTGNPGSGEPWVFPLTGERANNSENGFWVTTGQEPKEFMEQVARDFGATEFRTNQLRHTNTMVEMALNKWGYKVIRYTPGAIKL